MAINMCLNGRRPFGESAADSFSLENKMKTITFFGRIASVAIICAAILTSMEASICYGSETWDELVVRPVVSGEFNKVIRAKILTDGMKSNEGNVAALVASGWDAGTGGVEMPIVCFESGAKKTLLAKAKGGLSEIRCLGYEKIETTGVYFPEVFPELELGALPPIPKRSIKRSFVVLWFE